MRRIIVSLVLLCAATSTGCEALQRKFTRKPKGEPEKPSPVINFQDYSKAVTPKDVYRKHYLMFEYWNGELLEELARVPMNPKGVQQAAAEALTELEALRGLLNEAGAQRLAPLVQERVELNRNLGRHAINSAQSAAARNTAEAQGRRMHREFFWRDAEPLLKPAAQDPG
jgi:hypothetical protein